MTSPLFTVTTALFGIATSALTTPAILVSADRTLVTQLAPHVIPETLSETVSVTISLSEAVFVFV